MGWLRPNILCRHLKFPDISGLRDTKIKFHIHKDFFGSIAVKTIITKFNCPQLVGLVDDIFKISGMPRGS